MTKIYKLIGASGSSGGGSSSVTYTQLFNDNTDWGAASVGFYSITVSQSTHQNNLEPLVQVFELVGSNYEMVGTEVSVNASGDVTIRVTENIDSRFTGKIVIL